MISNAKLNTIFELDLEPIKLKLMHKDSGEGWSPEQANAVEFEYRRFLCLAKLFPHEQTAPLLDVDIFWHYHILDTMKYAADCEQIFGYFLHHFPYIGLNGEDDEAVHHQVGARMKELYEATFGQPCIGQDEAQAVASGTTGAANTAWCSRAAETAWCSLAAKTARRSETGKTAWCSLTAKTAWCSLAAKTARRPETGKTAWCSLTAKTAWCSLAAKTARRPETGKTAWCSLTAKTAWCSVTAETAWCSVTGKTAQPPATDQAGAKTALSSVTPSSPSQLNRLYSNRPALAEAA